ncbi:MULTISPECIES: DUF3574 domain-containing protein [unclassified Streptomyces]|uniref:DUF3574 domain-containing protein n=1 Tax=unclassified Streptomyces TaxID=2593676 RepID=UPI0022B6265F|nr:MULTISPECIES: DUF3574 domain-containing protein [unclassified Streptomyces]MCZ7415728.1 DUF3574 domain-containing protein [Streptomyces sp. WMMC897]MCZ7434461.1 DUF3574 domain-containing protein [Streptomyces sp. WMMC1477]
MNLTVTALLISALSLLALALDRHSAPASAPAPAGLAPAGAAEAAPGAESRPHRGERWMETRLFFGTGRHDGEPPITDEQFHAFLDEEITPRFPSGLTLQKGHGQWRDREGDINSEESYELILLYPAHTARSSDAAIEEIRRAYTTRWDLESVGRVDHRVLVDF